MNEVEKLLHDDSKEKRSAGRAAYTKGKSHRGCTLPCDNKSNKELKKMNGEVMKTNIKEPMCWKSFKKMPKDLQEEYLAFLHTEFGATLIDIALKMGLSERSPLMKWCRTQGLKTSKIFHPGHKSKVDQRWEKFWEGDSSVSVTILGQAPEQKQKEEDSAKVSAENEGCKIASFAVSLTNISSWDDAIALLKSLPLPKENTVTINVGATPSIPLLNNHGSVGICEEAL